MLMKYLSLLLLLCYGLASAQVAESDFERNPVIWHYQGDTLSVEVAEAAIILPEAIEKRDTVAAKSDTLMVKLAEEDSGLKTGVRNMADDITNAPSEVLHVISISKIFWTLVEDGTVHPLNDQLDRVKAPTLIIWGRHDQLIDVSCVEVLEAGIPNAESVVFEDVGHVPMIENPKGTAKHHLEFLAKY
jgi:pimeloyl-ACP methyl ester carboxylesterase